MMETKQVLRAMRFDGNNVWDIEAGSSIAELIDLSGKFYNEIDFDKIIDNT
jgi:hypothetical protein